MNRTLRLFVSGPTGFAILAFVAACAPDVPTTPRPVKPSLGMALYGCPNPFALVGYKTGDADAAAADNNADGSVCALQVSDGVSTYTDNNIPPNVVAGCPAVFTLGAYRKDDTQSASADRNGDGFVCALQKQNGEWVVVDNTHTDDGK